MDQIIKLVSEKAGISADLAKAAVTNILGFLKAKVPAAAAQLSALAGGVAESAPPVEDLGEALKKAGLPTDKAPAVLEAVVTQVKDKLPEGAAGELQSALASSGGGLAGLWNKVAGLFGKK
jgi:hypothetical protein